MNQDPWMDVNRDADAFRGGRRNSESSTESSSPTPGEVVSVRRRPTKTILLIVCAIILVIAVWQVVENRVTLGHIFYKFGAQSEPMLPEDFDNYDDWFDFYYDQNEYETDFSGQYNIPAAETGTGVTLNLAPLPEGPTLSLQEIYETCAPAVTAITAGVDDESYYYWGTGIVLTADGYILTNAHVIDGTDHATVTLWDDREFEAKLVGADSLSDIAVLKIEAEGLTCAEFGDSSGLVVGDPVVAIGNPLGEEFRGTMTDGIVSAINRDINYNGHNMTLLQTNAAINEGNSGGPLINEYGQVIGVTNMKMISNYSSIEGIAFAIPSASLKQVVDSLMESGRVTGRPGLGITVGAIPDTVQQEFSLPTGLYISQVSDGSSCQQAGIRAGDILIAINGASVSTIDDVNNAKANLDVGGSLTLTIWRDGEILDFEISLMEMTDLYG